MIWIVAQTAFTDSHSLIDSWSVQPRSLFNGEWGENIVDITMIVNGVERGSRTLCKSFLSAFVSNGHLGLPKETTKSLLCFQDINQNM